MCASPRCGAGRHTEARADRRCCAGSQESFTKLNKYLTEQEKALKHSSIRRMFYLALPPSVFQPVTEHVRKCAWSPEGINRIIVEKPFGSDLASSEVLSKVQTLAHCQPLTIATRLRRRAAMCAVGERVH